MTERSLPPQQHEHVSESLSDGVTTSSSVPTPPELPDALRCSVSRRLSSVCLPRVCLGSPLRAPRVCFGFPRVCVSDSAAARFSCNANILRRGGGGSPHLVYGTKEAFCVLSHCFKMLFQKYPSEKQKILIKMQIVRESFVLVDASLLIFLLINRQLLCLECMSAFAF